MSWWDFPHLWKGIKRDMNKTCIQIVDFAISGWWFPPALPPFPAQRCYRPATSGGREGAKFPHSWKTVCICVGNCLGKDHHLVVLLMQKLPSSIPSILMVYKAPSNSDSTKSMMPTNFLVADISRMCSLFP